MSRGLTRSKSSHSSVVSIEQSSNSRSSSSSSSPQTNTQSESSVSYSYSYDNYPEYKNSERLETLRRRFDLDCFMSLEDVRSIVCPNFDMSFKVYNPSAVQESLKQFVDIPNSTIAYAGKRVIC